MDQHEVRRSHSTNAWRGHQQITDRVVPGNQLHPFVEYLKAGKQNLLSLQHPTTCQTSQVTACVLCGAHKWELVIR